jgi:hypothetical protein
VGVETTKTAAECARIVIAQVNPEMPRTLGDSFIHLNKIHHVVEANDDLLEFPMGEVSEMAMRIGRHIAEGQICASVASPSSTSRIRNFGTSSKRARASGNCFEQFEIGDKPAWHNCDYDCRLKMPPFQSVNRKSSIVDSAIRYFKSCSAVSITRSSPTSEPLWPDFQSWSRYLLAATDVEPFRT